MRNFSTDHDWLALNTITLREQGDFGTIVDACARHQIRAIAPWRDEIATIGVAKAARRIRDAGLSISGYCRAGMLVADAPRRKEVREDNRRAIDEAKELGAPPVVVVVGGLPQYSRPGSRPSKDLAGAREMVIDELAELFAYAKAVGAPLALEPMHPMHAAERGCINTLRHALDICDRLDPEQSGMLGVAIDVYHTWWDPELADQIARAGRARLLALHVCDWLVPTVHMLNDRGMMGDGVIDIPRIRGWVESAGYEGFAEIEIFSDRWWQRPMEDVLTTCIGRHRRFV
jgi:sugar phosphate isomerase/epimerase